MLQYKSNQGSWITIRQENNQGDVNRCTVRIGNPKNSARIIGKITKNGVIGVKAKYKDMLLTNAEAIELYLTDLFGSKPNLLFTNNIHNTAK